MPQHVVVYHEHEDIVQYNPRVIVCGSTNPSRYIISPLYWDNYYILGTT